MIAWITAFAMPVVVGALLHQVVTAKLGPNGLAGFRLGVVMTNDATWQAAHRAAWPLMRTCLTLALAASTAILLIQHFRDGESLVHIAALQACGFLMIGTIGGMIKASNAAQDEMAKELNDESAKDSTTR